MTGSSRPADAILHASEVPTYHGRGDETRWVVTVLVPWLKDKIREEGCMKSNDGAEIADSHFIVGIRGRVFWVDGAFGVNENAAGYFAIGSGQEVALGSLYTSEQYATEWHPSKRIQVAIEAGCCITNGVGPPLRWIREHEVKA